MHRLRALPAALAPAFVATLLTAPSFGAPPEEPKPEQRRACGEAYERAQERRAQTRLVEARKALLVCSRPVCARFIRKDCGTWLTEVEQRLPSVVLAATGPRGALSAVRVTVDGKTLASSLDGKAVALDPGRHRFVFEHAELGRKAVKRVVLEGKKGQLVNVRLGPEQQPANEDPPEKERRRVRVPDHTWAWVSAGVGAAGLVSWGTFALLGWSQEQELRDGCGASGTCPESDVQSVQTRYLVADVSLGVGLVAAGIATYLFLSPPTRERVVRRPGPSVALDVQARPGGASAVVRGRF